MKGRGGFGVGIRSARARQSNTMVRDLLAVNQFTGAVLDFLRTTGVGTIKAGVVLRSGRDRV